MDRMRPRLWDKLPPLSSPHGTRFALHSFMVAVVITSIFSMFLNKPSPYDFRFNNRQRPASARQRVALCFAGHSRTFRLPVIHNNLLQTIVHPLRRDYDTDVFFLLRVDDVQIKDRELSVLDENGTLAATHLFTPAAVEILKDENELLKIPQWMAGEQWDMMLPPKKCKSRMVGRFPHTLYRSKQCLDMIRNYERRYGFVYDWVYRMRPDTVLFSEVTMPHRLREDTAYSNQANPKTTWKTALWWMKTRNVSVAGHGPIADQMTFSSRGMADVLLDAYDATQDCELYEDIAGKAPENILRFWLLKHGARYKAIPFPWATVRDYEGPVCEKMFYQYGPTSNWKESWLLCLKWSAEVQDSFPQMQDIDKQMLKLQNRTREAKDLTII